LYSNGLSKKNQKRNYNVKLVLNINLSKHENMFECNNKKAFVLVGLLTLLA